MSSTFKSEAEASKTQLPYHGNDSSPVTTTGVGATDDATTEEEEEEEKPGSSPSVAAAGSPSPNHAAGAATSRAAEPELSKNAKKRIARWERKMELKQKKKQQEKDIRLAKARAQGRDLDEERRLLQQRTEEGSTKRRRIQRFVEKVLPLARQSFQICVDCSFDAHMTDREVASLAKQIRYCYSLNRRTPHPCLLSVTSLGGSTLQHLQNVSGYDEWSTYAYTSTADPFEVLYKDRLQDVVYLTSDSETVLDHLEDSKIYVIGGIVDRNRLRGATLKRAEELGVATGKLPLAEHLKAMPTTPVLTVNHVFELLIKYRKHSGDWKKALQDVIPLRKHAEFESKEGTTSAPVDSSLSK